MRFARRGLALVLVIVFNGLTGLAGGTSRGARAQDPIDRIREADLQADLFLLAGDAMRGREGGTLDELKASMWIAERARAIGLEPAGDDGTYFQFFPLERFRVSASSPVTLGGKTLRMGRDVVIDAVVLATVDAPVVRAAADSLAGLDLAGKALVVPYVPAQTPPPLPNQSSPNAASGLRGWLRNIQRTVAAQNPAAIIALVGDDQRDQWDRTTYTFPRGTYGLDPDGTADQRVPTKGVPLLYVKQSALGGPLEPLNSDARLVASIFTDSFQYPSVNIIARVPGRDPVLSGEYRDLKYSKTGLAAAGANAPPGLRVMGWLAPSSVMRCSSANPPERTVAMISSPRLMRNIGTSSAHST